MLSNTFSFFLLVFGFYILSFINVIPLKIVKEQRDFFKIVAVFFLVIFAGCRWSPWEIGVDADIFDYDTYKIVYQAPIRISHFYQDYLSSDYQVRTMEVGYVFYSTIMRYLIGNNYNIYLLITNAILIFLLFRSFKVNGITRGFFFLCFFYIARLYLQYNFIIMRQAIALMIIWSAFHYIAIGKKYKFYIATIIATLFHSTALIAVFTPFFLKIKMKKNIFIFICISLFLCNILRITDTIFISSLDAVLSLFGQDGIGRFAKYILLEEGRRSMNLLNFIEIIPFVWIATKYNKELCNNPIGSMYVKMLYIFIFSMIVTMNFGFLTRMTQYFMFPYLYLLYFYIARTETKNKRLILSVIGFYLLVYACRYIMIWFYTTPYSFFLLH